MKYRHYAPKAPVTVITGTPGASAAYIAAHLTPDSGVICFDEYAPLFDGHIIHRLGPAADKLAQAQHVFDALRTFDDTNVPEIFAQCPDEGWAWACRQQPSEEGSGLSCDRSAPSAGGWHHRPHRCGQDQRSACAGAAGWLRAGLRLHLS